MGSSDRFSAEKAPRAYGNAKIKRKMQYESKAVTRFAVELHVVEALPVQLLTFYRKFSEFG